MIHPSYSDLMEVVNKEVEPGEQPVVQSRYSIVLATAKRASSWWPVRISSLVEHWEGRKPLSIAVDELYHGKVKIVGDED